MKDATVHLVHSRPCTQGSVHMGNGDSKIHIAVTNRNAGDEFGVCPQLCLAIFAASHAFFALKTGTMIR